MLAVLTSFFGMWLFNKLPQVWHPFFRLERFGRVTDDAFLLGIEARDRRFDAVKTRELLEHAGAIAVESAHLDPSPKNTQMPKWITAIIVAMSAFALIPFAIAAKARNSHSSEPHIHIFPDMDFQPKFKSDTAMDMFPDGRANRGEIAHVVPRGWLADDDLFYRGKDGDKFSINFPKQYPDGRAFAVDAALIARGQDRFNIYCTPCHGYDGKGMGAVRARVKAEEQDWSAVRNLVEVPDCSDGADKPCKGGVVVQMPNGQIFHTITNGKDTMMGYAAQIPAADRWAIVAYVRALQRAQNASLDDTRAP